MNKHDAKKLGKDLSRNMMDKISKEQGLPMSVFIISGDKTRVVSDFDPNSSDQKLVAAEVSRFLARKYKADCVVICAESFYSSMQTANKEEVEDLERYRQTHGTMEGHPLCQEAVFLSIEYEGGSDFQIYPFKRNDKGDVIEFSDPVFMGDEGSLDGILSGLKNPEKRIPIPDSELNKFEETVGVAVIPTSALGVYLAPAASNTPS